MALRYPFGGGFTVPVPQSIVAPFWMAHVYRKALRSSVPMAFASLQGWPNRATATVSWNS